MVLDQPLFSITPESFHPININLARGKAFSMVNFEMPVTAKHQGVIALEFIGIHDGSPPDRLDGEVQQCFRPDILYHRDLNDAIAVQDAEDRDFMGGAAPPLAPPSATEIGLIEFDLPLEKIAGSSIARYNGHPDDIHGLQNRGVTQSRLLGDLPGRKLQFKELEDPQPVLAGGSQAVDPAAGEVMKGILTPLATEPFTGNTIALIAPTFYAETAVVFPT